MTSHMVPSPEGGEAGGQTLGREHPAGMASLLGLLNVTGEAGSSAGFGEAPARTEHAPLAVVTELDVGPVTLVADHAGALFWPEEGLLVVADLHFEKGSSYADRGVLLPPYDTAATLERLARVIARYQPRAVFALGDSFHDVGGASRLSPADRETLTRLQRGRAWIWIAGNHDPHPPAAVGGDFAPTLGIGALTFRHEPSRAGDEGEIAGHLHPLARVTRRGRSVRRRCFVTDGRRVIIPAFGAYAGGLNIRDRAFATLFAGLNFTAHMLGDHRLYAIPAHRCVPD